MVFCADKKNKLSIGIYCIINTINGRFYIGSTASNLIGFWGRYKAHFNYLKSRKHHSVTFQRSFDKYGAESFQFHILEILDGLSKPRIREREQQYLDALQSHKPFIGFNRSSSSTSITDLPDYIEKCRNSMGRKIVAYDLDGSFYKEFISVSQAIEELDCGYGIHANCTGRTDRCDQWIFRYVDDKNPYSDSIAPYVHTLTGQKRDQSIIDKIVTTRKKNGNSEKFSAHLLSLSGKRRGVLLSIEHKIKISESLKGKFFTKEHRLKNDISRQKQIIAYDWMGYPIAHHESLKDCAKHYDVTPSTVCEYVKSGKPYKDAFLVYLQKNKMAAQAV